MAKVLEPPFQIQTYEEEYSPNIKVSSSNKMPQYFFNAPYLEYFVFKGRPDSQLGGLDNIGYSCYLNSVIQCLAYTPGFSQFCRSLPNSMYLANSNDAFFLDSLGKTFENMENEKAHLPEWIIQDLSILSPSLSNPFQQDAHELLLLLLQRLDMECLRSLEEPGPTFISQMFSGIFETTTVCNCCGTKQISQNVFYDITVPILEYSSTTEAVNAFSQSKLVPNQRCECGNNKCMKSKMKMLKLPNVLIVTLLRFNTMLQKVENYLPYDDEMEFMGKHYQLYAMIIHEGKMISHGHFLSYTRDSDGRWYKNDDAVVFSVSKEIVMKLSPYILFYQKI